MTTIKSRVERLETKRQPGTCPHGLRVVYKNPICESDKKDPGPLICPICGLERVTLEVVYVDTPLPQN